MLNELLFLNKYIPINNKNVLYTIFSLFFFNIWKGVCRLEAGPGNEVVCLASYKRMLEAGFF